MELGFLGTGNLGSALVRRLAADGHVLRVWNRTASKAAALASPPRVFVASTAGEAVKDARLVFLCLSDEAAVLAVIDDIAPALSRGAVVVDVSTVGPLVVPELERRLASRGAHYLACPLVGSPAAVERGEAVALCGGPQDALELAAEAIAAFSSRANLRSSARDAAALKLVVNCFGSAMMAGLAEALALAEAAGLSAEDALTAISSSPLRSALVDHSGERMRRHDYGTPRATVTVAEKDLRLM
jgi:3-hydroxyisobutyrate dehydrogenase